MRAHTALCLRCHGDRQQRWPGWLRAARCLLAARLVRGRPGSLSQPHFLPRSPGGIHLRLHPWSVPLPNGSPRASLSTCDASRGGGRHRGVLRLLPLFLSLCGLCGTVTSPRECGPSGGQSEACERTPAPGSVPLRTLLSRVAGAPTTPGAALRMGSWASDPAPPGTAPRWVQVPQEQSGSGGPGSPESCTPDRLGAGRDTQARLPF